MFGKDYQGVPKKLLSQEVSRDRKHQVLFINKKEE
jgi:hypothetical protein